MPDRQLAPSKNNMDSLKAKRDTPRGKNAFSCGPRGGGMGTNSQPRSPAESVRSALSLSTPCQLELLDFSPAQKDSNNPSPGDDLGANILDTESLISFESDSDATVVEYEEKQNLPNPVSPIAEAHGVAPLTSAEVAVIFASAVKSNKKTMRYPEFLGALCQTAVKVLLKYLSSTRFITFISYL
jgi:hypothetical protein